MLARFKAIKHFLEYARIGTKADIAIGDYIGRLRQVSAKHLYLGTTVK